MKKLVLFSLLLAAAFLNFPVSAQDRIGFIGGLNVANISNLEIEDARVSNRTGLGFGAFVDRALNENVALRFESMFLQKGSKVGDTVYDQNEGFFAVEAIFDLSYIESTILLKIGADSKDTQPYLIAGPTIGYLLDAKIINKVNGRKSKVEPHDLTSVLNNIDVGINIGAGLRLDVFFVEARYIASFGNILADPEYGDSEWLNRGLELMAGISAPIGR